MQSSVLWVEDCFHLISMQQQELIPHLFRTEFRKITSVLCRFLGVEHIQLAEDIASDTFLLAMETWSYKGLPANPIAWLHTVAKNKALNQIARHKIFSEKVVGQIKESAQLGQEHEIDLSEKNITDSQLQMLFALCHPSISQESQIGLSLRILCGFGIDEIATAFLTNRETINKRLFRAREKLREEKIKIELPGENEIMQRIETVLTTLYLLFSEGYYSESDDAVLREDLCREAMRLVLLLTENPLTNLPEVNALYALMCFYASRFDARKGENGDLILYAEQDETKWNQNLISTGAYYLTQASSGKKLSKYHLEATIAYWHTMKQDTKEKWENILHLYNLLLIYEYSPMAALNRTYAVSKVRGNQEAIVEAEKLSLDNNPFYYTLLGELYTSLDQNKARAHLQRALALAKTKADKNIIRRKLHKLETS